MGLSSERVRSQARRDPITIDDSPPLTPDPPRPARRRVIEAAILHTHNLSQAQVDHWTCPHGQHAGHGCVACYSASADPDPALPVWEVAAWFTTARPIPIRALQDIHRYGRGFALTQPSTPLVYVLSGQMRAAAAAEAVAGVVGFLLQNRHVVDDFVVTEIRAVHS
ncbi:MAG: hypothetical protein HOW71_27150 [Nonomuraea sp.]|nr:hypothetical protein [Nonomuraea sp.]NUP65841.1 hypothetical protein [Nonomuraea sp.]NUS02926.1 hypothetical protein [Nonomuraea sp.]NUT44094.1 hypothetical protein [Thermoactinospora sp.]